jgi:hypothetical protein
LGSSLKRFKILSRSFSYLEVSFDSKDNENKAFAYLKEASLVNEVISLNITLQI